MAEGEDKSQKTEEPTPKRLDEARKKGEVAVSREVNHWFMLLAVSIVMLAFAPTLMGRIAGRMSAFLGKPHAIRVDSDSLIETATKVIGGVLWDMTPMLVVLVGAALAAGLAQNGFVVSAEKIKPKLEKLSLVKGFGRLFSARTVVELAKSIFKLAIVAAVAVALLVPEFGRITSASALDPLQFLHLLWLLTLRLLGGVCAVVTLIAGIDFLYQKFEFHKSMKMSKQEIKDELKQSEGDPMVKARLRQLRMERARRRMMAAVPEADVVITNPTHYAVALKYDTMTMDAPKMLAKGVDAVALRIRKAAEENAVPVVENPPLARALHAGVEIDDEIPEAHYKTVAEVIGYVWRLKGKMPRRPR
ncbi:MAG: flagellar biosynthesis protein FlhB [Alphaproteobacteria bacterium]